LSEVRHLVVDLNSGATRPALPRKPVLSSQATSSGGVLVEQHAAGEVENIDVAPQTHAVSVQLTNSGSVEWKQQGSAQRTIHKTPGQVSVFPAMSPISIRTRHTGELLIVGLSPKFLKLAAHEMAPANGFELIPRGAIDEPFLKTISLALQAEVKAGSPGGKCYGETLATAIAVHLVRHHSSTGAVRMPGGGLAPAQFRRAVDYMHSHLGQDLSLESIAEATGLSTFHFSRLFKRSAGLSPHQYLIRLRLERARELLLRSRGSMAEIAVQSGFCDQSHFAMHFKRIYGVTPKAFARKLRGK
jgi:AraC family transcriptional regulator